MLSASIWNEILALGRNEMQCLCDEQEDEASRLAQERIALISKAILEMDRSPEVMDLIVEVQKQQRDLEMKARRSKEEVEEALREIKKQGQRMSGYHSATKNVTGYSSYLNLKS